MEPRAATSGNVVLLLILLALSWPAWLVRTVNRIRCAWASRWSGRRSPYVVAMIAGPVLSPIKAAISASVSPLWRACVTKYDRKPCGVTWPISSFLQAAVMRWRMAETSRGVLESNGEGNSKSPVARFFMSFSKASISLRIGTQGVIPRFSRLTCRICSCQFTAPQVNAKASPIRKPENARKQTRSAMASSFRERSQFSISFSPSGVGATSRQ